MRRLGIGFFAFSLLAAGPAFAGKGKPAAKPTVVAAAPADAKPADKPADPNAKPADAKPADAKPADAAAKPADAKPADAAAKPADPATPPPKEKSVDELLEEAGKAAIKTKEDPNAAAKPAEVKKDLKQEAIKKLEAEKLKKKEEAEKAAASVEAPVPTGTEDNDDAAEAAKVTKLEAVKQAAKRHIGPYELGNLDCRTLDGAGIERVLKSEIVAGEEPDVLCRIIVTQPGDIASAEHSLTLSVLVGGKETWRQQRKVRMSSIGRRAMVFVIPMDKIASDDETTVTFSAVLSPPATPGAGRQVKIKVRPLD